MGLRFEQLGYLHLAWVVCGLVVVVLAARAWRRRLLARVATANLVPRLTQRVHAGRRGLKIALVLAALLAVVLGLTDPRAGVYYEEVPRRGLDVIFVLDVSRSMLAEDLPPNRLARAKQYIGDVVDALRGDRVGLVTFAGEPVLKCPLTVNYSAFRLILNEVTTSSSPRGGTLIGDGVRLAEKSFTDEVKDYKAIVVITDGEDHDSDPVAAARAAYEQGGIRVYTIGLGDEAEGARVPDESGTPGRYLMYEGQQVWSKMNPQALRDMALAGGGAYIPVGLADVDMAAALYDRRLAQLSQREFASSRIERYRPQYPWLVGTALVLLVVELLISEQRGRERVTAGVNGGS